MKVVPRGGHTPERTDTPPRKNPSEVEKEKKEERGGGPVVPVVPVVTSKVSPNVPLVRAPLDPGAEPGEAHDLSGRGTMSVSAVGACSAATARPEKPRKIHPPETDRTKDGGRTPAGAAEAEGGLRRGGPEGGSGSQAAANWNTIKANYSEGRCASAAAPEDHNPTEPDRD